MSVEKEMSQSQIGHQLAEFPEELIIIAIDLAKAKGDKAFKAKNWLSATSHYSESVAGCEKVEQKKSMLPALFRNRSCALFHLTKFEESLNDAKQSLHFEPKNSKGNYRAGRALFELLQFEESLNYLNLSLCLLTHNSSMKTNKNDLADVSKWIELAKTQIQKSNIATKNKFIHSNKEKPSNRYSIDYSRFDDVFDDDDDDDISTENLLKQFQAQQQSEKLNCFNKVKSREMLHLLLTTDKLNRKKLPQSSRLTDNTWAAFEGIGSILANKSILQLPKRRLEQRLYPEMLTQWNLAITQLGLNGLNPSVEIPDSFSSSFDRWLVAGLGIGSVLVKSAQVSNDVSFTGFDSLQPSLLRVVIKILNKNGISFENDFSAGSSSQSPTNKIKITGLSGTLESPLIEEEFGPQALKKFDCLVLDPECFDDSLIGCRVLHGVKHAHQSLLQPKARVVPQSCRLYGMVVELSMCAKPADVLGIDLAPIADRYCWSPSFESFHLQPSGDTMSWKQLSEPFVCWDFNLNDADEMASVEDSVSRVITANITENGRANAIVTWFELDLGEDRLGKKISVSTCPSNTQQYWKQAVYWVPPCSACQGDMTRIVASRSLTATWFEFEESKKYSNSLLDIDRYSDFSSLGFKILSSSKTMTTCRDAIISSVKQIQLSQSAEVRVLEMQCGLTFGLFSMMAAQCGGTQILALDINSNLLSACETLVQENESCLTSRPTFSTVLPSQLSFIPSENNCKDNENKKEQLGQLLHKPVNFIIFPIPERGGHGLFEDGLLKLFRSLKKNKNIIYSPKSIITFPSSITFWALLIEEIIDTETTNIDYSPHYCLLAPRIEVNLNNVSHRKLSRPIQMGTVSLAALLGSNQDPSDHFRFCAKNVSIEKSGVFTSIVWWWTLDLCATGGGLSLSSSFAQKSPWQTQQGLHEMPKVYMLEEGVSTVSLSASLNKNADSLVFDTEIQSENEVDINKTNNSCLDKKDRNWISAMNDIILKEKKIEETISNDNTIKNEVVRVSEAIATDAGCILQDVMPRATIHPRDAGLVAKLLRLP